MNPKLNESSRESTGDPIDSLYAAADTIGYGAQRHQFVIVALACLSAIAGTIFHVHLAGPYSSGKSTVTRGVRRLLGPDCVVSSGAIQRLTPAAAARMNQRLAGRGLILDERAPDRELEALLRLAAAGDAAVRTITVNGRAVDFVIEPRFAIVEAMLDEKELSRQDRSRYLRLSMPLDVPSRNKISALSRQRFSLEGLQREHLADSFAEKFQAHLARLSTEIRTVVPFADRVELNTTSSIRDRLVNQVLAATSTVAWLRQLQRRVTDEEQIGPVVHAIPEDYEVVYNIVVAIGDDGEDEEIGDNALKLFRLWSRWARENENAGLRRTDVERLAADRLSKWQTYRALRELAQAGYADGPSGCGRSGDWRLTDVGLAAEHPNLFRLLPTPQEVARAAQDCNLSSKANLAEVNDASCSVSTGGIG